MAAAPAVRGHGAAPAPQAQGPQAEPARGAEGARDSDRDWAAIPDPLGGEALCLVMEVYGWLGWASSGTGGTGGAGRCPRGGGWPRRTTKGSSGR